MLEHYNYRAQRSNWVSTGESQRYMQIKEEKRNGDVLKCAIYHIFLFNSLRGRSYTAAKFQCNFSLMDKVESWHVGRFCSVDYESEVVFAVGVTGQSYSAAKFQWNFTLTDTVESWHVGRFCSVDYEAGVLFGDQSKGVGVILQKN